LSGLEFEGDAKKIVSEALEVKASKAWTSEAKDKA